MPRCMEALKLYNMKLLDLATLVQKVSDHSSDWKRLGPSAGLVVPHMSIGVCS